jgi:hypothetical protein
VVWDKLGQSFSRIGSKIGEEIIGGRDRSTLTSAVLCNCILTYFGDFLPYMVDHLV